MDPMAEDLHIPDWEHRVGKITGGGSLVQSKPVALTDKFIQQCKQFCVEGGADAFSVSSEDNSVLFYKTQPHGVWTTDQDAQWNSYLPYLDVLADDVGKLIEDHLSEEYDAVHPFDGKYAALKNACFQWALTLSPPAVQQATLNMHAVGKKLHRMDSAQRKRQTFKPVARAQSSSTHITKGRLFHKPTRGRGYVNPYAAEVARMEAENAKEDEDAQHAKAEDIQQQKQLPRIYEQLQLKHKQLQHQWTNLPKHYLPSYILTKFRKIQKWFQDRTVQYQHYLATRN